MKECIVVSALLTFAIVAKADPGFLKTLPAEDFAAAGLQKLTPEELARLESGLASIKWTPIQAALMSFSFCLFSNATGEI